MALGFALTACTLPATACECFAPPLRCAFREHGIVFVGIVEDDAQLPEGEERLATHTVRVVHRLKDFGDIGQQEAVAVVTKADGPACGYTVPKGTTWLVIADRLDDGRIKAVDCPNTIRAWSTPGNIEYVKRRAWWWRLDISLLARLRCR